MNKVTAERLLRDAGEAIGRRDGAAARRLLDQLIESDPRHLIAHLVRGDSFLVGGDEGGAVSAYRTALGLAQEAQERGQVLPPAIVNGLRRANQWLSGHEASRGAEIDGALTRGGLPPAERSPLIRETLAILRGQVPIQLQRPSALYVPGLPQRAFYEREEFDWARRLESRTAALKAEVEALLAGDGGGFDPYIPEGSDRSGGRAPNAHLAGDSTWSALHLLRNGTPEPGNADRCPQAMVALDDVPLPRIAGRAPMALYSQLRPGAHIRPHHGLFNFRLICHLPLIAPPGCSLRVGNMTREWREGEMLIFDDSMEHEAWNRSAETRIILLFEVWRPEIGAADREALTLLLEASAAPAED